MSDNAVDLNSYTPSQAFVEHTFLVPFDVINAAIYHAVTIGMSQYGSLPHPENTPGATRYNLRFPTGDVIFLYVLKRGDKSTTVQIHPVVRRGDPPFPRPETAQYIGTLMADCLSEAITAIRYEHPDFGLQPVEGITPPMPRYDVEGWPNVFLWHSIYASAMPDGELAKLQKVSLQTVYNARNTHGANRRIAGSKSERKVSKKK